MSQSFAQVNRIICKLLPIVLSKFHIFMFSYFLQNLLRSTCLNFQELEGHVVDTEVTVFFWFRRFVHFEHSTKDRKCNIYLRVFNTRQIVHFTNIHWVSLFRGIMELLCPIIHNEGKRCAPYFKGIRKILAHNTDTVGGGHSSSIR